MKITSHRRRQGRRRGGFTLEEVCLSLGLSGITLGSIITGYLMVMSQSEYAADSAAAQTLAMQRIEQTRAAKWDPMACPPVDEVVTNNFPDTLQALGVPVLGTNVITATVKTSIQVLSANPPLKLVRVDAIWSLLDRGNITNTVFTFRSPDQ